MIEFQTTQQIREQGTVATRWFIYGPTGSGKTKRAATFPNPLFIVPANEGSHMTLLQIEQSFDFVVVGKTADGQQKMARAHMMEILDELEKRYRQSCQLYHAGKDDEARKAFPWDTLVFESLTHYGDLVLEDISRFGSQQMTQQLWGHLSTHLRAIHDRVCNWDVHVVYTALDRLDQKGEGVGAVADGGPNMTGAMAKKLPSACDVIAYCEVIAPLKAGQAPIFRTHFQRCRQFDARARFDFPAHVDNFDFAELAPLTVPKFGA